MNLELDDDMLAALVEPSDGRPLSAVAPAATAAQNPRQARGRPAYPGTPATDAASAAERGARGEGASKLIPIRGACSRAIPRFDNAP
jgi:hypothetical protein